MASNVSLSTSNPPPSVPNTPAAPAPAPTQATPGQAQAPTIRAAAPAAPVALNAQAGGTPAAAGPPPPPYAAQAPATPKPGWDVSAARQVYQYTPLTTSEGPTSPAIYNNIACSPLSPSNNRAEAFSPEEIRLAFYDQTTKKTPLPQGTEPPLEGRVLPKRSAPLLWETAAKIRIPYVFSMGRFVSFVPRPPGVSFPGLFAGLNLGTFGAAPMPAFGSLFGQPPAPSLFPNAASAGPPQAQIPTAASGLTAPAPAPGLNAGTANPAVPAAPMSAEQAWEASRKLLKEKEAAIARTKQTLQALEAEYAWAVSDEKDKFKAYCQSRAATDGP